MAKVDNKIEMSKRFGEKFQKKFWRGMKRNGKEWKRKKSRNDSLEIRRSRGKKNPPMLVAPREWLC